MRFPLPQCEEPVHEQSWDANGFGCALTWACNCSVLGIDEPERFTDWLGERWAWKYGTAPAQSAARKALGLFPTAIKSPVRDIATQHPELLSAISDDPSEPGAPFLPPDISLLMKHYVETHPESTVQEVADAVWTLHGHTLMDNKEAPPLFCVGSVKVRRSLGQLM